MATMTQAIRGDVIRTRNIPKFKREYRNATGIILKWHYANIYSASINGAFVTLYGKEFDLIYRD